MDTYLEHHGILGQKWGVRRYQNADGSYTTAGKVRRNVSNATNSAKKTFKQVSAQQTSQKIVNKVAGVDKKKESVKDIAKSIAKGATIAAATTLLSSLLVSSSDLIIEQGKNAVNSLLNDQIIDKMLAKYYGWY